MATTPIQSLSGGYVVPAAMAAAPVSATGGDASALGRASFDALAGMGAAHAHLPRPRMPLVRRLARTLAPQPGAGLDDHEAGAGTNHGTGAASALKAAALQLLESLDRPEDDGLDRWQGTHDPLQRQMLLEQARAQLAQPGSDGGARRQGTRARLDAMQADLVAQHGPAVAEGKRHADAFEGALATLDDGGAGDKGTLSDLRRRFGAPLDGRRDAPLVPTALLEILLTHAGQAGPGAALGRAPAQLHEELRRRGRTGPRLWLSLQDASCFALVNTSYALAGDLRRELSLQAKTAPLAGQGALARLLLRLGEPELGQAQPLLRQLADMEHLTPRQRAAACRALRGVIARCPDGIWRGAALAQRGHLLDQLQQMSVEHHAMLPTLSPEPGDVLQARLRQAQQHRRSA